MARPKRKKRAGVYNLRRVTNTASLLDGSKFVIKDGKPVFIAARQKGGGYVTSRARKNDDGSIEFYPLSGLKSSHDIDEEISLLPRDSYDRVVETRRLFTNAEAVDISRRLAGTGSFRDVTPPEDTLAIRDRGGPSQPPTTPDRGGPSQPPAPADRSSAGDTLAIRDKDDGDDDDGDDDDDAGSVGKGKKRRTGDAPPEIGKRSFAKAGIKAKKTKAKKRIISVPTIEDAPAESEDAPAAIEDAPAAIEDAPPRRQLLPDREGQRRAEGAIVESLQEMRDTGGPSGAAPQSFADAQQQLENQIRVIEDTTEREAAPTLLQIEDDSTQVEKPPETVLEPAAEEFLAGESPEQAEALEDDTPGQGEAPEESTPQKQPEPAVESTPAAPADRSAPVPAPGISPGERFTASLRESAAGPSVDTVREQRRKARRVFLDKAKKTNEEAEKALKLAAEAEVLRLAEETKSKELEEAEKAATVIDLQRAQEQRDQAEANAALQVQNTESAEGRLSAGVVAGHDTNTPHAQDTENTTGVLDPSVVEAGQAHPQNTVDNTVFVDHDENGEMLMGTDQNGLGPPPIEQIGPNYGTSANAMLAAEERFERKEEETPASIPAEGQDTPSAPVDEAAPGGVQQEQGPGEDVTARPPPPPVPTEEQQAQAEQDRKEDAESKEAEENAIRAVERMLERIPGPPAASAQEQTLAQLAEIQETQRRAENMILAQGVSIERFAAQAVGDREERDRQRRLRERVDREGDAVHPEWTPDAAIQQVEQAAQAMEQAAQTMTMRMQKEYEAQARAWWAEFRTERMNAAVQDMETTPRQTIQSTTGDIQRANVPSADMSESEEDQMDFLFWVVRGPMNGMQTLAAWTEFFNMSVAIGVDPYTQAQINWLTTGNKDGDTSQVDYDGMSFTTAEDGDNQSVFDSQSVSVTERAISATPIPKERPPSRSTEPDQNGRGRAREYRIIDGKIVAMSTERSTPQSRQQDAFPNTPSSVSNIPDPRYSERGGKLVPNVRVITIRNPNYDPKDPNAKEFISHGDAPAGPDDKFINKNVPDVGAGSKEIGKLLEAAEADRLAASVPFKLYASVHSQAVDRFLGEKNYARLGLSKYKYFKSYTQQPFGPDDVDQQYNWNKFVMSVFGPTFYAFVNDKSLWRDEPVFDMQTPKAVTMEFMELNELIVELKRYQMKSVDRSSRVADSAVAQEPLEKHLSDFFDSRDQSEKEKIDDANAVVVALPQSRGAGDSGNPPGPDPVRPDKPGDTPKTDSDKKVDTDTFDYQPIFGGFALRRELVAPKVVSPKDRLVQDMDTGVRSFNRRSPAVPKSSILKKPREDDLEHRTNMFQRFNR